MKSHLETDLLKLLYFIIKALKETMGFRNHETSLTIMLLFP